MLGNSPRGLLAWLCSICQLRCWKTPGSKCWLEQYRKISPGCTIINRGGCAPRSYNPLYDDLAKYCPREDKWDRSVLGASSSMLRYAFAQRHLSQVIGLKGCKKFIKCDTGQYPEGFWLPVKNVGSLSKDLQGVTRETPI